jgi:hypothetical protein
MKASYHPRGYQGKFSHPNYKEIFIRPQIFGTVYIMYCTMNRHGFVLMKKKNCSSKNLGMGFFVGNFWFGARDCWVVACCGAGGKAGKWWALWVTTERHRYWHRDTRENKSPAPTLLFVALPAKAYSRCLMYNVVWQTADYHNLLSSAFIVKSRASSSAKAPSLYDSSWD